MENVLERMKSRIIDPTEIWTNSKGAQIACYQWAPETAPRFIVYISHGYADYSCAYYSVIDRLLSLGAVVFAHDHHAHGKSGPFEVTSKSRCQVSDYEMLSQDLSNRISHAKSKFPNLKLCLYGHSMGGLIATKSVTEGTSVDCLILESAAIQLHPDAAKPHIVLAAKILAKILPSLKVGKAKNSDLSRNSAVCQAKEALSSDFGDNGGATARTAVAMINTQTKVRPKLNKITCPTFIATGSDDRMADPNGSTLAASAIQISTLKVYDGAYHVLHDELVETTAEFLHDLEDFLQKNGFCSSE